MSTTQLFPNFEALFGELDFKKGDTARTVHSPAAYLADLLQLIDDKFESTDFDDRRGGIKRKIKLNAENTFTLIPYLDIVNELLEKATGNSPYKILKWAKYPFNLPFDLENERVKKLLEYLEVEATDLYALFQLEENPEIIARAALGLSPQLYTYLKEPLSDSDLLVSYDREGMNMDAALRSLQSVATFLQTTAIDGAALRELLHQNLGEEEAGREKGFFTNAGLGGYACLDENEEFIIWKSELMTFEPLEEYAETPNVKTKTFPPKEWFERSCRLIRLSQHIGLSYTELDLILRSCCKSQLDINALQRIAIVRELARGHELETAVVCAFFSQMDNRGYGHGDDPEDLFNKVYNVPFAAVEKTYLSQGGNTLPPLAYQAAGFQRVPEHRDFGSIENQAYRKRISRALQLSEKDLLLIYETFTARKAFKAEAGIERVEAIKNLPTEARDFQGTNEDKPVVAKQTEAIIVKELTQTGLPIGQMEGFHEGYLHLFFRISQITEVLDIAVSDLLDLLDLLEFDPAIRSYRAFDTLIHQEVANTNPYQMLASGALPARFWLVQLIFAAGKWMNLHQITAAELKAIQYGAFSSEKEESQAEAKKVAVLDALYQAFKRVSLQAAVFESPTFGPRASRVIYDTFTNPTFELVSPKDNRLLKQGLSNGEYVAATALSQLRVVRPSDFIGLGLEEKMQEKIYNNLVIKGYIEADGSLIAENFPQDAVDFRINSNEDREKQAVFQLLHDLYQNGNGQGTDSYAPYPYGNVAIDTIDGQEELALYPSHLQQLELDPVRQKELYDNLIFNGYIDAEGTVLQPELFANPANLAQFEIKPNLDAHSAKIYELIERNIEKFKLGSCVCSPDIFAPLNLRDIELRDLMENLRFNEYIDADNAFTDKAALLDVEISDFKLSLQFYPLRHHILEALQQVVSDFRANFYTITKEMLQAPAEAIVAEMIYDRLTAGFLQDNVFSEASIDFFSNEENIPAFDPGQYFDLHRKTILFKAIAKMIGQAEQYRLQTGQFFDLGFDENDILDILDQLTQKGLLHPDGTIPYERVSYFLEVNNALDLTIDGFEDFNTEIFFILHEQAKNVEAGTFEIVDKIGNLAAHQERVVFESLQEGFDIPADMVRVIVRHVFNSSDDPVETILLPLFRSVDHKDQITSAPDDQPLNTAWNRIRQFALLAQKLSLTSAEVAVIFKDQDLVGKYPESLHLPDRKTRFDALLKLELDLSEQAGLEEYGKRDFLLMLDFSSKQYYLYHPDTYELLLTEESVSDLSFHFERISTIDAAFNDEQGRAWIIADNRFFYKWPGADEWEEKEKELGDIDSNFERLEQVDASFVNEDGKLFLFSGDQYFRFSNRLDQPDEGYPRKIQGNWRYEHNFSLPEDCKEGVDAAFQSPDGRMFLFKGKHYYDPENSSEAQLIDAYWGRVESNFDQLEEIDAAFSLHNKVYLFSGNQYLTWSDHLESSRAHADEGSLQSIFSLLPDLPEVFHYGLDAAFVGNDDHLYVSRDNLLVQYAIVTKSGPPVQVSFKKKGEQKLVKQLGKVSNAIERTGKVNAAFSGLDGSSYLFSDLQFYRYSTDEYDYVDEGYPQSISGKWGGLASVTAAFVLDGKTYLFGKDTAKKDKYVRYSSNDYSQADEGYPKATDDNWWNLPEALVQSKFNNPDTVFVDHQGMIYLFKGEQFIYFDQVHRWWAEPQSIQDHWGGIPDTFKTIDAGFSGEDGRTYLFSDKQFVRYSDGQFNTVDDQFPKKTKSHWGRVYSAIQERGKLDAALTVQEVSERGNPAKGNATLSKGSKVTYLFSGKQFYCYTGKDMKVVDEGYPKNIEAFIQENPLYKHWAPILKDGPQAAFADLRNIYLFKDQVCYVATEDLYQHYPFNVGSNLQSAVAEEGTVYLELASGWHRISNPEGLGANARPSLPPAVRELDDDHFRNGLDAILNGVDRNTYLFKNGQCYDHFLDKSYPIREAWGIVNNRIAIDNRVDAALTGLDGNIYLFSGDQFVCYRQEDKKSTEIPQLIDGHPKAITKHWAGLKNVQLAYVHEGVTYLMETPDEEGISNMACYSTADYANEKPRMKRVDIRFWGIPTIYVEAGFDKVNAVLFDDENMFLLGDEDFVQLNKPSNVWTYPRPITQVWRNLPLADTDFPTVVTAFTGPDERTYFFSAESFVIFANGELQSDSTGQVMEAINSRWGKMENKIVDQQKIDAAVVINERTTFLFCADQYVRYSTEDYRFVDAGYPKTMVDNLRKEQAFSQMPESFEKLLKEMGKHDHRFQAIVANDRHVYLFTDNRLHICSQAQTGQFDLARVGTIKNNIHRNNRVDAAFTNQKGHTFLFSGDQYVRYSEPYYKYVDEGYPKAITELANAEGLPNLEQDMVFSLDAAFENEQATFFLKDKHLYRSDETPRKSLVRDLFQSSPNPFADPTKRLDAALVLSDGRAYFFSEGYYIRYANIDNELADEGYPKSIRDNWGDLPTEFEKGIDGAFVFEGRTYLSKGTQHVRYSNLSKLRIDSTYPQSFTRKWNPWSDYLLGDIKTIFEYKELQDRYRADDFSLNDLLDKAKGYTKMPFENLAEIFGWDPAEIKWLKQRHAFLSEANDLEVYFDIELLLKMFRIFAVADRMDAPPSLLYEAVWKKMFVDFAAPKLREAADQLYIFLNWTLSQKDWQTAKGQLHDELNLIKRDALLPYVINQDADLANARDVYEKFLIDVEMGNEAKTSRIVEAISAIQLFFHRYFISIEDLDPIGNSDDQEKKILKSRWEWMKNYRVWEANRKVFLYPENYIRPELRDTKTPAFETLEKDLLQGDINEAAVQRVYKKYLDEYTEVSRLKIAGGYVYDDPEDSRNTNLIFFGHTKSQPKRYYYRDAAFVAGKTSAALWQPWARFEVDIDVEKVYPVYAFGRLFVFWAEVTKEMAKDQEPENGKLKEKETEEGHDLSGESNTESVLRVKFSYYNLNKEWVPEQTLRLEPTDEDREAGVDLGATEEIREKDPITGFDLFVENAKLLGNQQHENIIINVTYHIGEGDSLETRTMAYHLTPELYTRSNVRKPAFSNAGKKVFRNIFGESIADQKVITLNTFASSLDAPWFSFDHRGGSFLCKPFLPNLGPENDPRPLKDNEEDYPTDFSKIDAAVRIKGGDAYFFNNLDSKAVRTGALDTPLDIRDNFGDPNNSFTNGTQSENLVTGAFVIGDFVYLVNATQVIKFRTDRFNMPEAGYPKSGGLEVILREFGFTDFSKLSGDVKIDGAYLEGENLFIHYHGKNNYTCNLRTKEITRSGPSDSFEAAYLNKEGVVQKNTSHDFDAAFSLGVDPPATDGGNFFDDIGAAFEDLGEALGITNSQEAFFAFKGDEYMELDRIPDSWAEVTWAPRGKIRHKWGNNLTITGRVDAAFYHEGKEEVYLFSRDQYFVYDMDMKYKSAHFTGNLSQAIFLANVARVFGAFRSYEVMAAFTVDQHTYLIVKYFHRGSSYQTYYLKYADTADLFEDTPKTADIMIGNWANLHPDFMDEFDSVLVDNDHLFLFKGDQYIKFDLTQDRPRLYELAEGRFDIIRLTSSTGYKLNEKVFAGGIDGLLEIQTQEIDETPGFSHETDDATTIKVRKESVEALPTSSHLDFNSANGPYYWEMFFHAPFLIAQSFHTAQKFSEAKKWYEYIFDPTSINHYWKFLPFLAMDVQNLSDQGKEAQAELEKSVSLKSSLASSLTRLFSDILPYKEAMLGNMRLSTGENSQLAAMENRLADQKQLKDDLAKVRIPAGNKDAKRAHEVLIELVNIIEKMPARYEATRETDAQFKTFQDDPFDPHAIANIRRVAYRKAIVMNYIDNLLDWGDMLFRKYTVESINEARMLYILAFDLLGEKPENLGHLKLPSEVPYLVEVEGEPSTDLNPNDEFDFLLQIENQMAVAPAPEPVQIGSRNLIPGVHASIINPYFYVPENSLFFDYYDRVEDRLYKIRNSLNILGVKQALPLFQPAIDPMAIVQAVGAGAAVGAAADTSQVAVPHYRFEFLMFKLREITQKLNQYGGELLAALEKKDTESFSILQTNHEANILEMMTAIKKAQIEEAKKNIEALKESEEFAQKRITHFADLKNEGMLDIEEAQIGVQIAGASLHAVTAILKVAAAFGSAAPDALVGPFIMGIKIGGSNIGSTLNAVSEATQSGAEALQVTGEVLGVYAQHERLKQEWDLALMTATSDKIQIAAQKAAAEKQLEAVTRELAVHRQEIKQQKEIADFIRNKFSNDQLYQWMVSKLSGVYYQTYKIAYDLAKTAEKAFRYERGLSATEVNFINGQYWNSQRKGLLASEQLGLAIDRMEKAFIDSNQQRLEISKSISLLELDPMAFLRLKDKGVCEFSLNEALFDYDYQGHYCRQIKTISISFDIPEGQTVNATLTQLNHKTVLAPDSKAVKFLLDPKDLQPASIRSDWRPLQQIALSHVADFEENNGLFELRFDLDRYLPFEGTGAVSNWRLELNGKRDSFNVRELLDVVVRVRYTALQGGEAFGNAVRGMLKPYPTVKYLDLNFDFHQDWLGFLENEEDTLQLSVSQEQFPAIASSKITGIFTKFDLLEAGNMSVLLNEDFELKDGKFTETSGLTVSGKGSSWSLSFKGDKSVLRNVLLVVGYKAKV